MSNYISNPSRNQLYVIIPNCAFTWSSILCFKYDGMLCHLYISWTVATTPTQCMVTKHPASMVSVLKAPITFEAAIRAFSYHIVAGLWHLRETHKNWGNANYHCMPLWVGIYYQCRYPQQKWRTLRTEGSNNPIFARLLARKLLWKFCPYRLVV